MYPLLPLIAFAGLDPTRWAAQLADRAGVTRETCHRWMRHGLSANQADRAAIALDLHPLIVWPEWAYTTYAAAVAA